MGPGNGGPSYQYKTTTKAVCLDGMCWIGEINFRGQINME